MRLRALVLVLVVLPGCSRPPISLIGTWEYSWTGDNHGTSTYVFNKDGTYLATSLSGIDSKSFRVKDQEAGTYTFDQKRISFKVTSRFTDYLNPDGTIRKHHDHKVGDGYVDLGDLSAKHFTIVGLSKITGDPDPVYTRQ